MSASFMDNFSNWLANPFQTPFSERQQPYRVSSSIPSLSSQRVEDDLSKLPHYGGSDDVEILACAACEAARRIKRAKSHNNVQDVQTTRSNVQTTHSNQLFFQKLGLLLQQ